MEFKSDTDYLYSYLVLSNNIITARFVQFSQMNKIGHYKLMFTIDFSCVNIGTRNIARFVGIYTGTLGENKLLYLQGGLVKILALFLFISLPGLACVDIEAEEELNTFIIKEKVEYSDLYHVSIYYPSEYLGAKAFRAKISFGDDFDNPSFSSSTIVSDTTKTKIDLKGYNYSAFESNQQVFDKAFLTVFYRSKKVKGDSIAFCSGPIAIYKLSDLAIKKV